MNEVNEIEMVLGSKQRVYLQIAMIDGSAFTPTTATYTLYSATGTGSTASASGSCSILPVGSDSKVWRLQCEIQPTASGRFELMYRFLVGTEIIKRPVFVNVLKFKDVT